MVFKNWESEAYSYNVYYPIQQIGLWPHAFFIDLLLLVENKSVVYHSDIDNKLSKCNYLNIFEWQYV